MFEEKTYENLMEDVLSAAPDDIDTRQGSIFYDAVSGIMIKIAKMYTDLELIFSLTQIDTASGEYLDAKASEHGITRRNALKAKYHAIFDGTVPTENERFFHNGLYFKVVYNDGNVYLEAEEPGTTYNDIQSETQAVPVDTVDGLIKAQFGDVSEYGSEAEDDENMRRRLKEKISGAGENGNKSHYKVWCESVDGVGKARIFPLWNGANTVKAVLISYDGLPCTDDIVSKVQEYIDPESAGLGEGVANLGAHFTAVSVQSKVIDISATIETDETSDANAVTERLKSAFENYFRTLVMNASDGEEVVVRYSGLGAVISSISGVIDYCDLTLNGNTGNIAVDELSVPVLGVTNFEFIQ